jgi:hypothetical protein
MCKVAEICSTGVRVTLSDVPEVQLTATNSELPVQDAGLAAKAGTLFDGIGPPSDAVFFGSGRSHPVQFEPEARRCITG